MQGPAPDRVRRVSVTDPIAAARGYDYADAFELRLEARDRCSPGLKSQDPLCASREQRHTCAGRSSSSMSRSSLSL